MRQRLGCQKVTIVRTEHHVGQIRPCQQRYIPVCGTEHEMMHEGEKSAETGPDHQAAPGSTRQQGPTYGLAEMHGHRTHGQKMLHAPKPWQQLEPVAMEGSTDGHQVRLCTQSAAKNTTKTFIVRHFGNAMMVHNDREIWLWPPTYLKACRYFPYQGMRWHSIVTQGCERREGEPYRSQVRRQRR